MAANDAVIQMDYNVDPANGYLSAGPSHYTTKKLWLVAVAVVVAACSRDPLEAARAQKVVSADHWKVIEKKLAGEDDALFIVRSKTSLDAPEGSSTPEMGVDCSLHPGALVSLGNQRLIETGDVRITFDDGAPVAQKWDEDPSKHRYLAVPQNLRDGFLFRLTNAKMFAIEISPKGGKPQRAEFAVLDLKDLMNRESSCKSWLAGAQNPASQAYDPWTQQQKGEGWVAHRLKIGGEDQVVLSLRAKNTIHAIGSESTANLNVACGFGSTIYIAAPGARSTNVRVAFDGSAPVLEKWTASSNILSPSSLDARRLFLVRLLAAKTFSFEYTPSGGSPQTSTFDLLGLKDIVNREKSCESWVRPAY